MLEVVVDLGGCSVKLLGGADDIKKYLYIYLF